MSWTVIGDRPLSFLVFRSLIAPRLRSDNFFLFFLADVLTIAADAALDYLQESP